MRKLKRLVLQDGVEVISEMAFMCCYNLRYIELPNTVLVLKRSAFSSSGLRDVSFSINMKQIDDFVFGGCRLQLHTKLPNSITFVGVKALGSCRLVNEDIKADCIKRFGEEVFQYDNYRI